MSRSKIFKIGEHVIKLGETKEFDLLVAKQYDFTEMRMPVKVIRGKEDGPRLFVCAAIHGDEVNGTEIIKRLIKSRSFKKIKGTLVVVPIVNLFGFNSLSRYLPDRRDLNRCFPGSLTGSLTSRLAYLFVNEIMSQCTHGIDLHTGAIHRTNLPQIRVSLKDRKSARLAHAFNVPVILDSDFIDGTLRKTAYEQKIPILVFEGGEALRYDEVTIRSGIDGVLAVMDKLGMIERPKKKNKIQSYIAKGRSWVRAPHGGSLIIKKQLGSLVNKDDVLAVISDPLGNENIKMRAPKKGIIVGQTQLPLVNRGDAVFHLATFEKTKSLVQSIGEFDDRFDYESR